MSRFVSKGAVLFAAALLTGLFAVAGHPGHALAAGEHEIDLIGAWHVTVHYRDSASENPETDRWDDKVWRFEKRGSRLEWAEFPIVVFSDRTGRFEAHEGTRERRVLHFW